MAESTTLPAGTELWLTGTTAKKSSREETWGISWSESHGRAWHCGKENGRSDGLVHLARSTEDVSCSLSTCTPV